MDEFAIALEQVHGPARSIDVAKVIHDTRILRKDINALTDLVSIVLRICIEPSTTEMSEQTPVEEKTSTGWV